jgi:hypothetical protein
MQPQPQKRLAPTPGGPAEPAPNPARQTPREQQPPTETESPAAGPDPAATGQPVESGQSEQPATSATDSDTFTDALTALTDETRRRVERNTLRTGGKTLTQLAMFDLDDIIRAEAQLELCIGALLVTREHGEDAGRTQLSEALGVALGDRRRYSCTFANGVVEATHDAARAVLHEMRQHVNPTALLARVY